MSCRWINIHCQSRCVGNQEVRGEVAVVEWNGRNEMENTVLLGNDANGYVAKSIYKLIYVPRLDV